MTMTYQARRTGEGGNVLFLILIAVALFAALSYAVTQSSRSGGGDASSETSLINSAQLTQYPASVRTAIVRMIINGTAATDLEFNGPSAFASLTSNSVGVFHPSGGGAVFQAASKDVMANGAQGTWYYNGNFEVANVGTSSATSTDGNDVIAFLPGIKQTVCTKINTDLGIASVPTATADLSGASGGYTEQMDNAYNVPASETSLGVAGNGTTVLAGQSQGCFKNSTGSYVYYQVLVER